MAKVTTVLPPDTLVGNVKLHTNQLTKTVESQDSLTVNKADSKDKVDFKMEIIWRNVVILGVLHVMGVYAIYMMHTENTYWKFLFHYIYGSFAGVGITAGAHRLWTHRAYKAKVPMRIILMLMQTASLQTPICHWARDHRVHHKFTDTDADPHNSTKGFFFSHVGWLMMKKHPEVTRCGRLIDMSDIENDPVVIFQAKHYWYLGPLLAIVVPMFVPMYFWNERFRDAFFLTMLQYVLTLNFTWLVNSAAHMWGFKPYDKRVSPTENMFVSILAYGEGWHNYHHVYPWDYKAAELGNYRLNVSTAFIDFFAWLGLAYDLKYATPDSVSRQVAKYGDGHWVEPQRPSNK